MALRPDFIVWSPSLSTEATARAQFSVGQPLVLRHGAPHFVMVLGALLGLLGTGLILSPLFYPTPFFFAFVTGPFLGFFAYAMIKDTLLRRAPNAWIMAQSGHELLLHFRHHFHYNWPESDPTVLRLPLDEISHIAPHSGKYIRYDRDGDMHYTPFTQFVLHLKKPLAADITAQIMHENTRMHGSGRIKGRAKGNFLEVSEDGLILVHNIDLPPHALPHFISQLGQRCTVLPLNSERFLLKPDPALQKPS